MLRASGRVDAAEPDHATSLKFLMEPPVPCPLQEVYELGLVVGLTSGFFPSYSLTSGLGFRVQGTLHPKAHI